MLEFFQNAPTQRIIVTLTETTMLTINPVYYLFYFKHIETKQTVAFIKNSNEDLSQFVWRYNMFDIDVDSNFIQPDKPVGNWNYEIYEQTSNSNLDPTLSQHLVEKGKMIYYSVNEFNYSKYNPLTSYSSYNG
jgi:hypothetical protein